ncbi:MAG: hypothetical protein ACYCVB_18030 [Bacilli bacterium]
MIIYALDYLGYSVAIIYVLFMSSLIGSYILRKTEIASPEFKKSLAIGVGLATLAFSSLLLLAVHLFYWYVLLILSAIVIFLLVKSGFFRPWLHSVTTWRVKDLVVLFALVAISLPSTLHPPTYWDSIEYHLPIVRMFTDSHHLAYNPFLREDFLPESAETLYSMVFTFTHSGIAIQMFVSAILVLLSWSVGSLVLSVTGSWTAGRVSSFLVVGIPIILQLGVVAYTDIALCFMVFLGTVSLLTDIIKNPKDRLFVSAIVFGFAIAIKDTGGLFWAIAFLVFAFYEYRRRTVGLVDYAKHALIIGLIAVPWYIRDFVYTGNPFYPLFTSIIPNHGPWTTAEAQSQVSDYSMGVKGGLLFHPSLLLTTYHENYSASVPVLVGVLLYAVRPNKKLFRAFLAAVSSIIIISYTTVFVRYELPAVTVLAACAGIGIYHSVEILHRWSLRGRMLRKLTRNTYIFVILAGLIVQTLYSNSLVRAINPISLNPSNDNSYLSLYLPAYPVFEYLNEKYGSRYTVYGDNLENMRFYCKGKLIGDWFGEDSFFRVFGGTQLTVANIAKAYRIFHEQGIGFLMIPQSDMSVSASQMSRYFSPVMASNEIALYKVL